MLKTRKQGTEQTWTSLACGKQVPQCTRQRGLTTLSEYLGWGILKACMTYVLSAFVATEDAVLVRTLVKRQSQKSFARQHRSHLVQINHVSNSIEISVACCVIFVFVRCERF